MPIYEYLCEDCGVIEAIQRFDADPLDKCPSCKKDSPEKIISRSSFQLKGGGWYNDGYTGPSNKSEKSPAKAPDSKPKDSPAKCSSGCKCH